MSDASAENRFQRIVDFAASVDSVDTPPLPHAGAALKRDWLIERANQLLLKARDLNQSLLPSE